MEAHINSLPGLVEELKDLVEKYNWPDQRTPGSFKTAFKEILSRYESPTVPVEIDSLESWENEAEAFYKATGMLRPGKDIAAGAGWTEEREEEREKAYKIWCAGWSYRDKLKPNPSAVPVERESLSEITPDNPIWKAAFDFYQTDNFKLYVNSLTDCKGEWK